MRTIPTNLLSGKRLESGAVAALWVIAIGVPALMLNQNQVRAARSDTESRLVARLAATLKISSTNPDELFAALERQQREMSGVRYVRVCNRLGVRMDWASLFAQIRRSSKGDQIVAARVIAEECEFDPGTNLKFEQMRLMMSPAGPPIGRSTVVPERMRTSVD